MIAKAEINERAAIAFHEALADVALRGRLIARLTGKGMSDYDARQLLDELPATILLGSSVDISKVKNLEAYITTAAVNGMRDHFRRTLKRPEVELSTLEANATDDAGIDFQDDSRTITGHLQDVEQIELYVEVLRHLLEPIEFQVLQTRIEGLDTNDAFLTLGIGRRKYFEISNRVKQVIAEMMEVERKMH